jgi:hypothetical protein
MNRKSYGSVLILICLTLSFLPSCGSSSSTTTPPPVESIAATAGTPQSTTISTQFVTALQATVTTGSSGTSGVTVTFTAPSSGASGTFANGTTTDTETTGSNGVATSAAFTANATAGSYSVTATASGASGTANFSLTNNATSGPTISATGGTPQTTTVNAPFGANLQATVLTGTTGTSGVTVTFTAPSSGASGTFANGTTTDIETTVSSGIATSTAFTANGSPGSYTVTATSTGATGTADFSLTNTAVVVLPTISATAGSPQDATVSTAFATALQATVTTGGSPTSGVSVTFTAPPPTSPTSNLPEASGTFAGGASTVTVTTDSNGNASAPFTANATTGSYTVTATAPGVSGIANFGLRNNPSLTGTTLYSFYLSGLEAVNEGPNFYALAGSVAINSTGTVIAGEQDYNDGFGFTSPEPIGDTITGGTLAAGSVPGQYTLTLITNNTQIGVANANGFGVETLGVQFVNSNHALIIQFDGTATSSGSLDLQTLPSTLSGGYAFTLSGVDASNYAQMVLGGVFTVSGTSLQGVFDVDDFGTSTTTPTLGTTFTGTISAPDTFGRGAITGISVGGSDIGLNYYIVNPKAIRIVDVDSNPLGTFSDSAVGSAFGQGTTTFTKASLGTTPYVFAIQSNSWDNTFAAAGMFTTNTTAATFAGIGDDDEVVNQVVANAASISGTYSVSNTVGGATYNGYGSLTINAGDLGDVSVLGIYLTDPSLNLSDPNNTTTGLGGALVADLDGFDINGTGILVPQTSTASFTGSYAFGAQEYNPNISGGEFDFVGQGSVASLFFDGTGLVSDPWFFFSSTPTTGTDTGVTFTGAAVADTSHPGRYTLPLSTSLTVPGPNDTNVPFSASVVLYEASGGQVFWLETDSDSVFLGSLQQQGSLTGIPSARKNAADTTPQQKQ